ncbi:uncharacterized protein PGTG_19924 [Puccinia graminis f. sp. tritici CRL 75-36-700-3]|uniref:DUF6589 domain-containing protein n=1 Tax=Puccinia graminis f. sp. tritici (strain CRL 75-36-700-3 / race SCCL) TaxID=418459 RepID=E3LBH1_PUCGT|nr:uncharacterized protein PGTG_19924 [Puccinia graminis f. sp. tritici CRL 75-36-700-3]EFP93896.2 hypothetical protein PGTG_19924 [Puccinia graminis f. sp. tritici CRL 75-36-700-3]
MIPLERHKELKSEASKVLYVCDVMNLLGMTPKQFFLAFVEQTDTQLRSRRRLWADDAWDSTKTLLEAIGTMICSHKAGETNWNGFILSQAKTILKVDKMRENPRGMYFNSKEITADFFSKDNLAKRDHRITVEEHPFLYNLLKSKILHKSSFRDDADDPTSDEDDSDSLQDSDEELVEKDKDSKIAAKIHRAHVISKTICSMVDFASNRQKNSMQLENAAVFLACGVSDCVNKYLNFIGLSSCCLTAHLALHTLGKKAEKTIINRMKLGPAASPNLCPLICIDNLDFQQAVHVKSVDNQSTMFHGTWGYLHLPHPDLLDSVDPKDLSLEAYRNAIANSGDKLISPAIFILNKTESGHYQSVLKSQVASVMITYIAKTSDKTPTIPLRPPPIEVLAARKPDITMLKLMVASDNSSEGVGEVLEGLARQSGLKPSNLRAQRKPND